MFTDSEQTPSCRRARSAVHSTSRNHAYAFPIHRRYVAFQWGWKKSEFCNKSCGVTIVLGPRLRNAVVQVYTPSPRLTGRATALRLRNKTTDLLVLGCYFPHRGSMDEAALNRFVELFLEWVDKILSDSPRRTIPIIMGDVNDQFGVHRERGGILQPPTDKWVGA